MVRNYIKPVVSVMDMEPSWADYPLLLYRPPDITFDALGQNKKPPELLRFGGFFRFLGIMLIGKFMNIHNIFSETFLLFSLHFQNKVVTLQSR